MAKKSVDLKGHRCPMPVMRLKTMEARKELEPGDEVEIVADCENFTRDLREFCEQNKKVLVETRQDGKVVRAKVRY